MTASPIFKVIRADMPALWQDLGRRHAMQLGVPEAGAMDIHALLWANRLLGRNMHQPVIEITLGGFEVEFLAGCQISITGADLGAKLNDVSVKPWRSVSVKRRDRLQFNMPLTGLRSYLAVSALLEIRTQFGSAASDWRETDRRLQLGDTVSAKRVVSAHYERHVPSKFIPDYTEQLTLDLVAGYQFDDFPEASVDRLLEGSFEINSNSNRMAYNLSGPVLSHKIAKLSSEGIAYGAIQVPPDGNPVVLLNDRQTIGGYPKLGCITRLSGSALSQRFAPTKVRFSLVQNEYATRQYKDILVFFSSQADELG